MTSGDPLHALGEVVAQYLQQCGIEAVIIEPEQGHEIDLPVLDAVAATGLMPLFSAVANWVYVSAGLDAAMPVWPIELQRNPGGIFGLEARWTISAGAAPWGLAYPSMMTAVHNLLTRDEDDPRMAVVAPNVLHAVLQRIAATAAA